MKNPTIELLFPTPIIRNSMDRDFTPDEIQAVSKNHIESHNNAGNITSNANYVLDQEGFGDLKKILQEHVDSYVDNVIKPKGDFKLSITQSWLNWTSKGENHHDHRHPNSFISGVLYINAGPTDKITFYKSDYQQIKIYAREYDVCNADSWWFEVKTGGLVLFPSSLIHGVTPVEEDQTRISLAFNTFFTGTIGESKDLNELKV